VTAPDTIKRLVDRFHQQADTIRSTDYNETLIRIDFINPLMKSLGWDIDNSAGYAEQYREVVHEDRIKVAGQTKAPDYSFRIGGTRKFFLEAKKPAVDIKNNWEPAYQLRRYAWSAKLAVSLLTDFEEFAIYDTRIQPKQLEGAHTARREFLRYTEYEQRWDFLYGTFSKDAVLRGDFDRYGESKKGRGALPFDDVFLGEIEEWRKALAISLARRNKSLDEASLNFAVQRIIDRILFLRIAEDRGTETAGQLQGLLKGEGAYPRLVSLFESADERYNSGLFHFLKEKDRNETPDTLTPSLDVDDKTLKAIINGLYYPKSPYEFSVVEAEILGSVYERFLGKVITLTGGHTARIVEKPEVRKAGGVYYTPKYIVDYIIQNTVGKLLDGKSPKDAAKIKVLDPACGSGSFLIGAYQFLLNWHLEQYASSDPETLAQQKNAPIRPAFVKPAESPLEEIIPGWALTIAERKRILLDHLHGVDLDAQAVEVTKLNLLLKCLEGETSETLGFQTRLFRARALPDLGKNILCGNSLIATDIIGSPTWEKMTPEDRERLNPFDYERAFSQVFKGKRGAGFDAVIGNPPYIRMEAFKPLKDYLAKHYQVHEERADLYAYVLERSVKLLRAGGRCSMIVSNKFIRAKYGLPLRRYLGSSAAVDEIVDLAGLPVFEGATVRTVIISLRRSNPDASNPARYIAPIPFELFSSVRDGTTELFDVIGKASVTMAPTALQNDEWLLGSAAENSLLEKLEQNTVPLAQLVNGKVLWGVKTGCNDAFVIDAKTREQLIKQDATSEGLIKPMLVGEDVRRYATREVSTYLIYPHPNIDIRDFPAIEKHLAIFKDRLIARATKQEWFELQQPSVAMIPVFNSPKIVYPEIAPECRFALDETGNYSNNKTFVLPIADRRLLGILNSRLANFYFQLKCAALEGQSGRYLEFRAQYVSQFPVRVEVESKSSASLVSLVDTMIVLHARLSAEQLPQRREQVQREIDATDRQIDALVYQLYGLTDEEIAIVEEATL
jgi:hypothetical protein